MAYFVDDLWTGYAYWFIVNLVVICVYVFKSPGLNTRESRIYYPTFFLYSSLAVLAYLSGTLANL